MNNFFFFLIAIFGNFLNKKVSLNGLKDHTKRSIKRLYKTLNSLIIVV